MAKLPRLYLLWRHLAQLVYLVPELADDALVGCVGHGQLLAPCLVMGLGVLGLGSELELGVGIGLGLGLGGGLGLGLGLRLGLGLGLGL